MSASMLPMRPRKFRLDVDTHTPPGRQQGRRSDTGPAGWVGHHGSGLNEILNQPLRNGLEVNLLGGRRDHKTHAGMNLAAPHRSGSNPQVLHAPVGAGPQKRLINKDSPGLLHPLAKGGMMGARHHGANVLRTHRMAELVFRSHLGPHQGPFPSRPLHHISGGPAVSRHQTAFHTALGQHVAGAEAVVHGQALHAGTVKLHHPVVELGKRNFPKQVDGQILGGGTVQRPLQPDAHRLRRFNPHASRVERHGYIRDAYAQAQAACAAIGRHMSVRSRQQAAGPDMALFQENLMAHASPADFIKVLHAPSPDKVPGRLVALGMAQRRGGHEVIQDHHRLHPRRQPLRSVLLQQRNHPGRSHVVGHDAVYWEKIHLSGLNRMSRFLLQNLFRHCPPHGQLPFLRKIFHCAD